MKTSKDRQLARTSYRIYDVDISVILDGDQAMHHLDAIWRAGGRPKDRTPAWFLTTNEFAVRVEEISRRWNLDPASLTFTNAQGIWATQYIAIDYARRLSAPFGLMVDQHAVIARQMLKNKASVIHQELRRDGKLAHAESSEIREQFDPMLAKDGHDIKHAVANARLCKQLTDKLPSEHKQDLGLNPKDSLWDVLGEKPNALRLMALVYEKDKLKEAREQTSDPNVMIRIVEDNARKVREMGKQLEDQS